MNFDPTPRSLDYTARVRDFMTAHIVPIESHYWEAIAAQRHGGDWRTWRIPPLLETLKQQARAAGLWNLFLPDAHDGAGLSTLEYAPVAEQMGRSFLAPEVFNCNAPDTGNMEVLHKYGTLAQKARWLEPLLAGEIRSVFAMTEPDVASSDATNMAATAILDGAEVVINGRKWWSTNLGHPNAKVAIVMARTPSDSGNRHRQHSMVLVPLDTPGVEIVRMLPVFGEYDEPSGHGELRFTNVRVPRDHVIGELGDGFSIAQGRLGPGRIHHAMRCIGAAEVALDLMVRRAHARVAFGKPILNLGGNRQKVAEARVAIDQARLLTLFTAWKLDQVGPLLALTEISAIKLVAPRMLQQIVDDAIQIHGGAGLSRDLPLTALFAAARSLRLADGPDEVHQGMIARLEIEKRGLGRA